MTVSRRTYFGLSLPVVAALGSVVLGTLVLGLKLLAWRVTGSIALFSDALESTINIAAAGAALIALRISERPADPGHPYGHHKAEYFSAVFEGVLIVLAAAAVLREAYFGFQNPRPIDAPLEGMILNGAATVLNGAWAIFLIRAARKWSSPALAADGRHLMTDVMTSLGVLAGFALVPMTGWLLLDPVLAALVGVNIIWTGFSVVGQSVGGLMDAAVPPEVLERVRRTIASEAQGAREAHDLRTRQAGRMTFVEFHLVVSSEMPVVEAHSICDRIEGALRAELGQVTVTIHVEPSEKAKHRGVLVLS